MKYLKLTGRMEVSEHQGQPQEEHLIHMLICLVDLVHLLPAQGIDSDIS